MRVNNFGLREGVPGMTQLWAPQNEESQQMIGATQWFGKEPVVKESTTKAPPKGKNVKKKPVKNKSTTDESSEETTGKKPATPRKPTVKAVPGKPYDRFSRAVSSEVQQPGFVRIYVGLPPSQTGIALHTAALSTPTRSMLSNMQQLKQILRDPVPLAPGSLYEAVAGDAEAGKTLRGRVVDKAIAGLTTEEGRKILAEQPITSFLVDHLMSPGDLVAAMVQDKAWVVPKSGAQVSPRVQTFTPGDDTRAIGAYDFAKRLVATQLGRKLIIHGAGPDTVQEISPFGPPTGAPISLDEIAARNLQGQEVHTFQRHQ